MERTTKDTGNHAMEILIISVVALIALASVAYSVPFGGTITYLKNESKGATNGTVVNYTSGTASGGGVIYYTNISGVQQNTRWKGYVGNISGRYTLDDASGNTLYDWSIIGSPLGEVFATRTSGSVNWSYIKCAYANATEGENIKMGHTGNPADNISATFSTSANPAFTVGVVSITASTCNSTKIYVNDSTPAANVFREVLLYDGPLGATQNDTGNITNIVYTSVVEADVSGFDGRTYDFQMIVPEIGTGGWSSSTAYYFYIELT